MKNSAINVMQEIILTAVIETLDALKTASKGTPNTLLRDVNSIHPNSVFADLPKEAQQAILNSARAAFIRFHKEGYAVEETKVKTPPHRSVSPKRSPNRRGA